jgi:dihydrofolate reductase
MISIIVAVSEDYGIGRNNELLYNIPEDLRRFKQLTMGQCLIMGKRTWESLPRRPLPGRVNIVLTDIPGEMIDGCVTSYSIEDALSECPDGKEIFIIGGGSVYRQFMPFADRLYITHVHEKAPADTWFPEIKGDTWEVIEKEEHPAVPGGSPAYAYVIYRRKN